MSALEVRRKFGSVLDMVAKKRVPVTILRGSKPLAVLIPADEYEARNSGRQFRLRLVADKIREWKTKHRGQLESLDAVQLVRKSRDER